MKEFQILEPHTLLEAFELYQKYASDGCVYISGGTDVIPPIRKGVLSPRYLIDLQGVSLSGIEQSDGGVAIGAATTMKEIYSSKVIKTLYPALAQACASIGCVQTRGLATIGGNNCAALPSADSTPALFVYDAMMEIYSKSGTRTVPISEFVVCPRKTCLQAGEILTKIHLPSIQKNTAAHFIKFGRRNALSLSIVNEAICAVYDGEKIKDVRITIGACGPTPLRILEAEKYLEGKSVSQIDEKIVASLTARAVKPISDLRASEEYRRALAGALVCKSLRVITNRSNEEDIVERSQV